jgi:predicted XRE-type DNA-binding protein
MSIPLDRLYHYIESIASKACGDIVIYRFYPHGSKKIEDLTPLTDYSYKQLIHQPMVYCNDQEPLNYDLYSNVFFENALAIRSRSIIKKYELTFPNFNFQQYGCRINLYDKSLLIHSEKRSTEVKKYQNNYFIPVYYWSHAVIAKDWFRYAEHVCQNKQVKKLFLIYNRAWSGTREYRLKFADLLIQQDLIESCNTTINAIEPELNVHYDQHTFINQKWRPDNTLEKYFVPNVVTSYYSADFDIIDYESTDIEIVLETLFDDDRIQLTEKSIRPIACGQPFILAATAGSLEYLRSYGFKTFDSVWDESYDLEVDSTTRLNAVVKLMKEISQWTKSTRIKKLQAAQQIANYNKKHFFSKNFYSMITTELQTNLKSALEELEDTNTSKLWFDRRKKLYNIPEIKSIFFDNGSNSAWPGRTRKEFMEPVERARQYYLRSLNKK